MSLTYLQNGIGVNRRSFYYYEYDRPLDSYHLLMPEAISDFSLNVRAKKSDRFLTNFAYI